MDEVGYLTLLWQVSNEVELHKTRNGNTLTVINVASILHKNIILCYLSSNIYKSYDFNPYSGAKCTTIRVCVNKSHRCNCSCS